jgi:hypothetical protein
MRCPTLAAFFATEPAHQNAALRLFPAFSVPISIDALVRRWAMATATGKIIEFYIPKDFRAKVKPIEKHGELIEFQLPKKSA